MLNPVLAPKGAFSGDQLVLSAENQRVPTVAKARKTADILV